MANVQKAVPFFGVADMARSLRFYLDGLGFQIKYKWIDEGKLRWCWLENGGAALMLQEYRKDGDHDWTPKGKLGEGVSICFICQDAIAFYRELRAREVEATKPFVGNSMWVTSVTDPDGYHLDFESQTDAPEESEYEGE
jgi:catechol 2,3-dioxygenase-like lactoylglutathione lyase family enzyme